MSKTLSASERIEFIIWNVTALGIDSSQLSICMKQKMIWVKDHVYVLTDYPRQTSILGQMSLELNTASLSVGKVWKDQNISVQLACEPHLICHATRAPFKTLRKKLVTWDILLRWSQR